MQDYSEYNKTGNEYADQTDKDDKNKESDRNKIVAKPFAGTGLTVTVILIILAGFLLYAYPFL